MTVQQILTLAGTIDAMVNAGKIVAEDVIAFLASKGADADQLQANRTLLQGDIQAIDDTRKADGAE